MDIELVKDGKVNIGMKKLYKSKQSKYLKKTYQEGSHRQKQVGY